MKNHKDVLAEALKKFDALPRSLRKSCDGTRETARELAVRVNWLRNRAAEAA